MEVNEMEPIGSIMSAQAQGNVTQKVQAPAKEASEYSTRNVQPTEAVDATTNVVEKVQDKGSYYQAKEQSKEQVNEQIRKAVEQMNKNMISHSEAVFGIHEETNRVTIKIIDQNTKEVIKEFPPEKTLDMIAKVWEMAGIMVDERR